MSFVNQELFVDKYQRNNKQTGVKNLRCFPACAPEGHQSNGFCGRTVQINLEPGCRLVLAEFTQVTTRPTFLLGQIVSQDALRRYHGLMVGKPLLSPGEPDYDWNMDNITEVINSCRELFKASSFSNTIVELRVRRGWHYDWVSNRHTCMNLHCLRVYMFEILPSNDVRCIKILDSPSFQVYSRRRSLKNLPSPRRGAVKRAWTSSVASAGSDQAMSESTESPGEESSSEENHEGDVAKEVPGHMQALAQRILRPSSSSSSSVAIDMDHRPTSLPITTLGARQTMIPPPLPVSAAIPAVAALGAPSSSSSLDLQQQHIVISYLSQLLEFIEVSEHNLLRVDVAVSPFVFAKAIEGINPAFYDSVNSGFLFRLRASRMTEATSQKKIFCNGIAAHISRSPALSKLLLGIPLQVRSHAELMSTFLSVIHQAFAEYAIVAGVPLDALYKPFKPQSASSPAALGIFHPLFPTDNMG